jgi:hypothetical protein
MAALRRRGRVRLNLDIAPEGIAGLVALGWLDPRYRGDPTAVPGAIIDLANAALDAGLRPRYRIIR